MKVRPTKREDLPAVMPIFDQARAYMRAQGNMQQWSNGYPAESVVLEDIEQGHSFVCETEEGEIVGTFALVSGDDYAHDTIDGAWLNDLPYCAIHRVASAGKARGIFRCCLDFSFKQCPNIRIDTFPDNMPMRRLLIQNGFTECGMLHSAAKLPRVAYHKCLIETYSR